MSTRIRVKPKVQLQFIDSFKFMDHSLDCCKEMCELTHIDEDYFEIVMGVMVSIN